MTAEPGDEPTNDAPSGQGVRRQAWRRLRMRRRSSAALVLIGAAVLGVWTQRAPIADRLIRDQLVRANVAATYQVRDIGITRQRLTDVVIGDPRRPDLVADWVEVDTRVRLGVPQVVGVRAGRVRLRARLIDGQLRLGEIDKLLPPPSGKPFQLPDLLLAVADGRMRLETPQGVFGIKLSGRGRLNDGFVGDAAVVAERVASAGCRADRVAGTLAVRIDDGQPVLRGPIGAAAVECSAGRATAPRLAIDLRLNNRLDRWRGKADLTAGMVKTAGADLASLAGAIAFDGGRARTTGTISLDARRVATEVAVAGRLSIDGRYQLGTGGIAFAGSGAADGLRPGGAAVRQFAALGTAAAGTPGAPLLRRIADALTSGARQGLAAEAVVAVRQQGDRGQVTLSRAAVTGRGIDLTLAGGDGIRLAWPGERVAGSGQLVLTGEALPQGVVRYRIDRATGQVVGTADFARYAAADASLALTPARFRIGAGRTRIDTVLDLSGPFAGGRIDGLRMPLAVRQDRGGWRIGPECVDAGFDALRVSSLALDRARLRLCPADGGLAVWREGRIMGGVLTQPIALAGRLGSSPITLSAQRARLGLAELGFSIDGAAVRLGDRANATELDLAQLSGNVAGGVVSGELAGAGGKIGAVPLLMSDAAARWRFANGALSIDGTMRINDADPSRRFETVASRDFRLTLANNRIAASGTLSGPVTGIEVADVVIRHDLGTGIGDAEITVPGIDFRPDGLQPAALTRLALGVVAEVEGVVRGAGNIRWSPEGVTSTGRFSTENTNLAAAFGPVSRLTGELRFTDLLGLESAPGQQVTLGEVNPGIAVQDGAVTYRLLPGQRVAIEGGRWPLAGGQLILEPTILDFSSEQPRQMTFRVVGVDAGAFLQQFEFENLNATGTFDGVLPMVFDASGGRIEHGRLTVRESGGTIAYVGELTKEDLGTWGDFAFQSLKALRYQRLTLELNGPLAGEMVTEIRFAGISQGEGTQRNFIIDRLARLPLVFNVRVTAPFRQLLDSVQSFYDPRRLVERNLPQLIDQQAQEAAPATDLPSNGVQPRESDNLPRRRPE